MDRWKTTHLVAVVVDSPILLAHEGCRSVHLPVITEGREEDAVLGELALDRGEGDCLVLNACDGVTVGVTLVWPASLRDDDTLASTGLLDALNLHGDEIARATSGTGGVEVGVAVDGGVVGRLTELWVGNHSVEGVDGHDGSGESSGGQETARGIEGSKDGLNSGALVDELIADRDGVHNRPVAVDVGDDGLDFSLDVGDVEHTEHDLGVLRLDGRNDVADLVTVDAVDAVQTVSVPLLEVGHDLFRGLAATSGGVWRVGEAESVGAAIVVGGRVLLWRWWSSGSGRRLGWVVSWRLVLLGRGVSWRLVLLGWLV